MPLATDRPRNASPRRLAVNLRGWELALKRRELASDREAAASLGLSQSTVSRALAGSIEPGGAFVAAVLEWWPTEDLRELFRSLER